MAHRRADPASACRADRQRQGIGGARTAFALDWMKRAGMSVAMVETGFDPGHAPAGAVYENGGFRVLPAARATSKKL